MNNITAADFPVVNQVIAKMAQVTWFLTSNQTYVLEGARQTASLAIRYRSYGSLKDGLLFSTHLTAPCLLPGKRSDGKSFN